MPKQLKLKRVNEKKPLPKNQMPDAIALKQQQKISKIQLVKNWLLSGKTITHRQASKMYGYDRLSDGIWKLRNPPHNMNIVTTEKEGQDRFLNSVSYGEYKWLGETPKIKISGTTTGPVKTYKFEHVYPMKAPKIKQHIVEYLTRTAVTAKIIFFYRKSKQRRVEVVTDHDSRIFIIIQNER